MQPTIIPSVVVAQGTTQAHSSILPLIVGAAGGVTMLFLLFLIVYIALKKRKLAREGKIGLTRIFSLCSEIITLNAQSIAFLDETENKTHPDHNHIQVESNGYPVGGGRGLSSPIHKNSRLNGILPRMNITANPLDEKVRQNF